MTTEHCSLSSVWPGAMRWFDVTMDTPAQNLALDEVLLEIVEANPVSAILRTWEPASHFVVLGRSNRIDTETDETQCRAEGVPIFRRASGGGAVVLGPGCLAYAVMIPLSPELRAAGVASVTKLVMSAIAESLSHVVPGIEVCGTSDLAIGRRKFSGNSQRWLKNALLHHGTILYDYDLPRISRLLKFPSRQPEYRSDRSHQQFVGNLACSRSDVLYRLSHAFRATSENVETDVVRSANELADVKYISDHWIRDR